MRLRIIARDLWVMWTTGTDLLVAILIEKMDEFVENYNRNKFPPK